MGDFKIDTRALVRRVFKGITKGITGQPLFKLDAPRFYF
jgi:hypothetical protein